MSEGLPTASNSIVNVGLRLRQFAAENPGGIAIAEPHGRIGKGGIRYRMITFSQLEADSNQIAAGLRAMGVAPGMRIVLMVPQSIDFIALVFALLKLGVVAVLIDPGMGRMNILRCLAEVDPQGFIAVPIVQALRLTMRSRFPRARLNVTVGRRWFWRGPTLSDLRSRAHGQHMEITTRAHDPAAIIFTTGSTGPPKGVLYQHENFDRQVTEIRDFYNIQPGEVDIAGFPLFALFNAAMGVTTVIPQMDPTRPAAVKPQNIIDAARQMQATQAFGSPALWNVVGRYCETNRITMPSLRRVLSAGAPVPPHVLQRMTAAISPDGNVHTPYGATESLPVASISAKELLADTASRSAQGAGTCVGRRFPSIEWRVIAISDEPIATIDAATILPPGEIGEIIVRGPVVTREYVTRIDANAYHKIIDGNSFWHRIGDVGYLDDDYNNRDARFWFCGRKSHRVRAAQGVLYTIPCEAIFNQHPHIYRTALVGVGPPGRQEPVIVAQPWPDHLPKNRQAAEQLIAELRELGQAGEHTRAIQRFYLRNTLPVDIRHNAKIFREKLATWVARQTVRSK